LAIVITVTCEGLDHRLEFRDDGEIVMLDHSEKLVRSFVVFGAKPPECMIEIDKARDEPIKFLTKHLKMDRKVLAYLACDFAEHVLPIWCDYYPNDKRPEKAIQAARKYMAGKIKLSTLERAWAAAKASREESLGSAAASAVATAVEVAVSSVEARGVWSSAKALAALAVSASEWAESAVYRQARANGNATDVAVAAERKENKWQTGKAVQVLEAVSRGEDPWRS
jgi:hypothetical protein